MRMQPTASTLDRMGSDGSDSASGTPDLDNRPDHVELLQACCGCLARCCPKVFQSWICGAPMRGHRYLSQTPMKGHCQRVSWP